MEDVAEVGYFGRLRQFSRNARLYLLHVIGMDLIHGAWEVLFNLYLLAVGFDIRFVGIRIAVLGIAGSLAAIPAGRLADRIDRKWGFIIGDGGGLLFNFETSATGWENLQGAEPYAVHANHFTGAQGKQFEARDFSGFGAHSLMRYARARQLLAQVED